MPDVLWISCTGAHPVCIVKKYDEIENRWKYYIGTGNGRSQEEDIWLIVNWGQKFYNLDFIAEFCNTQEV